MEQIAAWEAPPEKIADVDSASNKYTDLAAQLRARKGEWALLEPRRNVQSARSLASNVRNGKLASFEPGGAFEARTMDTRVWIRYVGEPEGWVPPRRKPKPNQGTIRAWAKATGRKVTDRGQLPASLVAEWERAMRNGTVNEDSD